MSGHQYSSARGLHCRMYANQTLQVGLKQLALLMLEAYIFQIPCFLPYKFQRLKCVEISLTCVIHASARGFVIIAARWNYYMKTAVSCRARCLLPPAVGMLSLTVQSFMYLFSLFFQLPFQLSRHSWSLS